MRPTFATAGPRERHRALQLEPLEPRLLLDATTDLIQLMVDGVSPAAYTDYLTDLASFADRNSYTYSGAVEARDYIVAELEAMGFTVELQTFDLPALGTIDWTGTSWVPVSNIIATLPGTVTPEQEYLFTAHYDSIAVHPDDYADPFAMVMALLMPSTIPF